MVPPKFAHKGMLWWRVVLTAFLFRIRPELLKADEGGGSGGAELLAAWADWLLAAITTQGKQTSFVITLCESLHNVNTISHL